MGKQPGASSFIPHPCFIHQYAVNRLIIAGIGLIACLSAVVSLAQQGKLPQATEPANIIRLRQEWFYQQRAYPNKHIPPGARLKGFGQVKSTERVGGLRLGEHTANAFLMTLPSAADTMGTTASQQAAGQGSGLRVPVISPGQTTRARVRMVVESWWETARHPQKPLPAVSAPFLSYPGFWISKRRANQRAHVPELQGGLAPMATVASPMTTFGGTFDGPGESDGGGFPPDGAVAAGSNDVVAAINALIGIYDKAGNQLAPYQSMSSFFSNLGLSGGYSDPRVVYDEVQGRFIITDDLIDYDFFWNITDSYVLVAVSQTSDPTGLWNKFAFETKGQNQAGTTDTWSDYPTVGLNSSGLYIATDQYEDCNAYDSSCVFSDAWIMVISLSDLYAANPTPTVTTFKNVMTAGGAQAAAIQPALTFGNPSEEFLVAALFPSDPNAASSSVLNLFSINTSGTPSLTRMDLAVPSYAMPPDASQPGTVVPIATNDFRLINAVWAGGNLWCAQNVADDLGTSAVARWYEIGLADLSQPMLQDWGTITGSGNAFYPAITPTSNGQVTVVFSTSSTSQYPSAAYSGRAATDPPGALRTPVVYRAGLTPYTQSYTDSTGKVWYRWGDYSGISLDPAGGGAWAITEYSKGPDPNYGTAIANILSPPSLVASPNPLKFADQPEGSTSGAQVLQVNNAGPDPVTLGIVSLSGEYATEFQMSQDSCSITTLAAGAGCRVSLSFTPTTTGPKGAELSFGQSIGGLAQGTIVIGTYGNSISNASVSLSPPTLTFPNQAVSTLSSPQVVTLTNTGSGALGILGITTTGDFSQTNDCGTSVNAGASCTISVTFAPMSAGTLAGTLTITDDAAGSPHAIALSGTAVAPEATLTPAKLDFGQQLVGRTATAQSVTLTDTSSVALTISNISTTNWQFAQTNNCPLSPATLAGGASCTINVSFTPSSRGTFSAGLLVTDNAPDSPQLVTLTGQGIQPAASLSTTGVSFGNQNVGTASAAQTLTLTNTSQDPLTVASIAITGADPADFKASDNCLGTVAASASCTISMTFTPSAPFSRTATLSIMDNAANSPQKVNLAGTGTGPVVDLSPSSLTFSGQTMGVPSAAETVILFNSGNAALGVSSIVASGDFAETNTCGSSVAENANCAINVIFTPTAGGNRTGTLSITDSASNSPQTVALSGTGEDFTVGAASGSSSSATVPAGSTASYSLSVTPEGGFNQAVSLACSGAPLRATCTVTPSSVTLDGTHSQNVQVAVTTTAPTLVPPGPQGGPPAPGGLSLHPWWVALLMLLVALAVELNRRRRLPLLAGAVLLAALALSCGGGGGGGGGTASTQGTPPGNYTMTITATSGSLTHQTTAPLIVQ